MPASFVITRTVERYVNRSLPLCAFAFVAIIENSSNESYSNALHSWNVIFNSGLMNSTYEKKKVFSIEPKLWIHSLPWWAKCIRNDIKPTPSRVFLLSDAGRQFSLSLSLSFTFFSLSFSCRLQLLNFYSVLPSSLRNEQTLISKAWGAYNGCSIYQH